MKRSEGIICIQKKNAWIEMRSEERESAGLQEGPAHVPKMERHT